MATTQDKFPENPPLKYHKTFIGAQICLRILAIAFTLAATCLMVTDQQSIELFGLQIDARYSYSSAFKFFAFANAFACAFSVLSLFLALILARRRSNPTNYFFLFLHDLLMMSLVLAGCAAATAVGYVGRYGNSHAGWMAICGHFGKFCNRGTVSMVLSFLSFLFFLVLAIISANKSRQIRV